MLNSWDYIEYAHSQVNITKVLQGLTLCFSVCTRLWTQVKHQQKEGSFVLTRSVCEACQTNKTYGVGICLLQYGSTVSSYPGVLSSELLSLLFSVLSHLWSATMQLSSTHPIKFMLLNLISVDCKFGLGAWYMYMQRLTIFDSCHNNVLPVYHPDPNKVQ